MLKKILLLLIAGALFGCASPTPAPTPPTVSSTSYPVALPLTPFRTPYPGQPPTQPPPTLAPAGTLVVPTPDSETGVVVGQLLLRASGSPGAGLPIYLGEILPVEPGPGYMVTLKEQESPHTTADSQGRFVLAHLPPNTYVLIIWTAIKSKVVADPDDNTKEFSFTVEAGKTVDLGAVTVDWP